MTNLLNGPQTLGRGRAFWSAAAAVLVVALVYPLFVDSYDVGSTAYFLCWVFMALGLCLMWGYNGMMSFGQTFFFGVGGYAYGVIEINLGVANGGAMASLVAALAVTAVAAALLGYFMIYGRIGGMFFGIVTFAVTLALAFFLNQTAGPEWHIGTARLNGFNGMQGMDPLALPWFGGDIDLEGTAFYYFVLVLLIVVYLLLRLLVNSRFGNVLVAIREDPLRAELLGYDVRRYSLVTFVIGSVLGGLSGALYCSWGQFISPSSVGLPAAAMPVVWVAFSGRSDVTATLIGTLLLIAGFQALTIYSEQWALILMGVLLAGTVLIAPDGLIVSLANVVARRRARGGAALKPSLQER
ncbi:MAG: ABC transporter permease [Proteobacteria bacterium]|nr:ABC transporter permease [Pseudomonadota bacterium]